MKQQPAPPGMRAAFDQALAARSTVERTWPFNEALLNDEAVERAYLAAHGAPDSERLSPGHLRGHEVADLGVVSGAFLLWPRSAHPLSPSEINTVGIERMARDTAPNLALADCDRCGRAGCTAVALIPFTPKLVALMFCASCSAHLTVNHGPVRWTLPVDPEEPK